MDVRLVKDISEIRFEWERLLLESDTGTVFQTLGWVSAWQSHARIRNQGSMIKERELTLAVYEREELVGVGVFEVRDTTILFGAMRPQWGDAYGLADFGDIIAQRHEERRVWMALLRFFNSQFTNCQLQLDFVRESSPSFGVLRKLGQVREQEVSPYITVPRSWESYVQGLPRKKRHELRRKMKKVFEESAKFSVTDKVTGAQISALVKLVKESSEDKQTFMSRAMERFFEGMMKKMFAARLGILFTLTLNDEVMAMVLGFTWKEAWYLYNGGFSSGSGLPVGIALSGKIVEEAILRKVAVVDFLRGHERYKYDLGAVDQKLYKITIDN